jgi:SAM-dependent methyltransferase
MTYTEADLVASIERLAGDRLATLTQDQRDRFDQFHAGGPEAVERMLPGLRLTPGITVLDVGSGLGGPARQVARASGCSVVGVDITPGYVEAARELTRVAGLGDRVAFLCGDVAAIDGKGVDGSALDGSAAEGDGFDAAYTLHVQMNVADKRAFFTGIARRLRPGARFATFEVCLAGRSRPALPLPWSLDGTDSFLATAPELLATIESSGFESVEWTDETAWVRRWFEDVGASVAAGGGRAALPALLDDGPARMLNFAIALDAGVLTIHRGAFVLAP